MKKINLLVLLFLCALTSCRVSNNDTVTPEEIATINTQNTINLSALIVGKWQLAEIGKIHTINTASQTQNGCGRDNTSSTEEVVSWSRASSTEVLNFKESGDFTKDFTNDSSCKGTFKISFSTLTTQSDCGGIEGGQLIDVLTKNVMILQLKQSDTDVRYKYEKL